ncbi:patatin-like phospholipase family protein [Bradyrhizobium brasilense]|uniref:patatin-like phospholipase family protein n=1 Tax=Bradyrhizobium brasilense TaxID=1419277 RepID=UPI0024B12227|nr:patatin-like phospholipase family protein [Bradyrhizobium australafricanum]WFU31441.1 patatin-like phospholipase family protein [Bradyrhizobium australafricanum]
MADISAGASATDKVKAYQDGVQKLQDLSALCLSGGGIRSAAFALGVIQGLADRRILSKFDYLSTVSGGGYVGSLLTAWVQRAGYDEVEAELRGGLPARAKISPLQHLRRYTSYLTPRAGVLSTDTLTLFALFVRNLLLNWLILIPALIAGIVGVKLLVQLCLIIPRDSASWIAAIGGFGIAMIGAAVLDSVQQRPGWGDESSGRERFIWYEMLPVLIGGSLVSIAALKFHEFSSRSTINATAAVIMIGGSVYLIAAVLALSFTRPRRKDDTSTIENIRTLSAIHSSGIIAAFTASGVLTGYILAVMVEAVVSSHLSVSHPSFIPFVLICLGPPLFVGASFAGELLYCGITSYVRWGDAEREWLARAAGYHGRAAAGWAIAMLLIFGGAYLVLHFINSDGGKLPTITTLAVGGGGAGLVASLIGKASSTAAVIKKGYATIKDRSAALILAVSVPLFFGVLVSTLSAIVDATIHDGKFIGFAAPLESRSLNQLMTFFAAAFGLAIVASWAINTNRFSLHGIYRNRLIRAFLGASKADRSPNHFTDFDQWDNIRLNELWPAVNGPDKPPHLHVINMALNVVATRELAWRERKALSFTATPLSVGCGDLRDPAEPPATDLRWARGYYRSAAKYGGTMDLGTAMTISGAAASPNMGYHSSLGLSFLLTFFNVRLGAWLGNPGPAGNHTFEHRGPVLAAKPMFEEALGLTDEGKAYVNLSDGGHFDNLGLYEMVRRRCRLIVVSDAGADPNCAFEDLGNALRKISIDLDAEIDFQSLKIVKRTNPPTASGSYCAVADISYREGGSGLLLYLKPDFQGIEPAPVRSYAIKNTQFPHEPTVDQWFGETQFEAYRALGRFVVNSIDGKPGTAYPDIGSFISAVAIRNSQLAAAASDTRSLIEAAVRRATDALAGFRTDLRDHAEKAAEGLVEVVPGGAAEN